ncbi:NAD(P)/FAD-dependent oxidoreductase [Vulcanisaeta moutnovskia]|uniref:NAD(P)/FAD-dependent oxidoreductase n=1 Tax=Vulcanisaeta moutnovskia TaxID=985052 RepID=UPI00064E97C8|nr:FAD-dependent oxidoreductase [Vulcanisaeta moutnovskia]
MIVYYDMIIVGAGSTGSTIAYYLANEGFRALVIDKRGVAGGMTAYSTGIVRSFYANEDVAKMAHYTHNFFMNFEKESGINVFTKTGLLIIGKATPIRNVFDMLHGIDAKCEVTK